MRLAVIADIHGNVLALEAVLADIARRGADLTVDLGDCVSGPLWPAETYTLLQHLKLPTVRGNHDFALGKLADKQQPPTDIIAGGVSVAPDINESGSWEALALSEMTPAACRALGSMPSFLVPLPGVTAFHGTPTDDTAYLLEDVVNASLALATAGVIAQRLGSVGTPLILCAHSHQPRIVQSGVSLIVNPGSVGCAAYADPTTPAHLSETGTPHARYALLDDRSGSWTVDLIAVVYDWTQAAERAEANNRKQWATAIRTGRVC